MKKPEAQAAVRRLCHVWKSEVFPTTTTNRLHFSDFVDWLRQRSPEVLQFRSTGGALDAAERWFDSEFGQRWRN